MKKKTRKTMRYVVSFFTVLALSSLAGAEEVQTTTTSTTDDMGTTAVTTTQQTVKTSTQNTIVSDPDVLGGFIAPAVKYTTVNGERGAMAGLEAALIFNHAMTFGVASYHLAPNISNALGTDDIRMSYHGLTIGTFLFPDAVVHGYLNAIVARGALANQTGSSDMPFFDDNYDKFLVVEPGAHVILNITSHLHLAAGVTYRFVSGIDDTLGVSSDSEARALTGVLALQLGKF